MKVKCLDFLGVIHMIDSVDLTERVSAYGLYRSGQRILLIQDPRSLRWEPPGGGVEKGETTRQGLAREFTEETGASIVGKVTFLAEWTENFFDLTTGQAWRSQRKFYTVKGIEGHLLATGNNDDSATAQLVPLSQIGSLEMAPRVRQMIERLIERDHDTG